MFFSRDFFFFFFVYVLGKIRFPRLGLCRSDPNSGIWVLFSSHILRDGFKPIFLHSPFTRTHNIILIDVFILPVDDGVPLPKYNLCVPRRSRISFFFFFFFFATYFRKKVRKKKKKWYVVTHQLATTTVKLDSASSPTFIGTDTYIIIRCRCISIRYNNMYAYKYNILFIRIKLDYLRQSWIYIVSCTTIVEPMS